MIIHKQIPSGTVTLSDNVEELKRLQEEGKITILILTEENKLENTSFVRFAITPDMLDEHDELEKYIEKVVCRYKGIPLLIGESNRTVLRELSICDLEDLIRIYDDAHGLIEPFFDSSHDAKVYLENYVENVYDIKGFGIWGVEAKQYTKNSDNDNSIIGIMGISQKDDSPELVYAFRKDFQGRGYAFEAAETALNYFFENSEYDHIDIVVSRDNEKSLKLAKKLEKGYKIAIKIT